MQLEIKLHPILHLNFAPTPLIPTNDVPPLPPFPFHQKFLYETLQAIKINKIMRTFGSTTTSNTLDVGSELIYQMIVNSLVPALLLRHVHGRTYALQCLEFVHPWWCLTRQFSIASHYLHYFPHRERCIVSPNALFL